MSGTENEAVEAGRAAIRACMHDPASDAKPDDLAKAAHDAMRPIIARDVVAGICRREGHKRIDMTPLGSAVLEIRCGRCGETWNEPRPTDAVYVVLRDKQGNPLAVGDLAKSQCPGCKRTIGHERCSSAGCQMPRFDIPVGKPLEAGDDQRRAIPGERSGEFLRGAAAWMKHVQLGPTMGERYDLRDTGFTDHSSRRGVPAPEPCPFDGCDTGPLGRDQLNAHIAQQHPDARSVQSVLGEDDPREDQP